MKTVAMSLHQNLFGNVQFVIGIYLLGTVSTGKIKNCNGGKPWGLLAGHPIPRVDSPNPVGDKISDTIGHVARHVTQRAVMQVVLHAQGHHPIRCSQTQLRQMDKDFKTCFKKIQYQVKCYTMSQNDYCLWIGAFINNCSGYVLGQCVRSPFLTYIGAYQSWQMAKLTKEQDLNCMFLTNSHRPDKAKFFPSRTKQNSSAAFWIAMEKILDIRY
eukprot:GFUD01044575.1.p1 GENE.GFUD01044575.1~~GFUD01044575.1.p1  ORF type:complete len:214 (-),score=34.40 GFUD01044575.1:55-696(-)